MEKKAIIIGAGPAGLTAAYELLKRTDIKPIILEKSGDIGGISKTVNYKGNRIDIGGHRFFSKSDRVMNWWLNIMPVQAEGQTTFNINYQNKSREIDTASIGAIDNAGKDPDKVMLVRRRLSRIYFLRKFFNYPIQLSLDTLTKLGLWTTIAIMFSYLKAQLLPRKPEKNLEDFMINRFGQVLYKLFFKDYTEKVWGIPCDRISAEWGAQRIKGVSISKAIQHAIQSATKKKVGGNDIAQKDTETSLIEQFLYPKFGPGQLWEEVARQVESMGGKILMHHDVKRIYTSESNNQVTAVATINNITGETSYLEGDYFFSTMPVQELIGGLDGPIPEEVREVAEGLQYRDFITVGILLKKLSFQDKKTGEWKPLDLKDTWIYIQEKDVKVGRLQLFNNWSPYMVKDPDTVWVGMEFFCSKKDSFWELPDDTIKQVAIYELEKIGLACDINVLDSTVLRMEKTYPAYFGTYERFDVVRRYVDRFGNLFLIGRNGMHKYNNSDHSMLTAMVAVDNIVEGEFNKEKIWSINTDQEYIESKITNDRKEKSIYDKVQTEVGVEKESLFRPLLSSNGSRRFLFSVILMALLGFIVLKIKYPMMNFIPDSYSYLAAAFWNNNLNVWPIGYSKILRIFSTFSESQIALSFFQFAVLEVSLVYFIYSITYLLRLGKKVTYVLIPFLVLNPVIFIVSNIVSADAIFISLSIAWFSQIMWLYFRPSFRMLLFHSLTLLVLFTIRYNALYYPILSIAVIFLSPIGISRKMFGIGCCIFLIAAFVTYNRWKFKEEIGQPQFAPFSGWQLASNALFMYSRILKDDSEVPIKFKKLHKLVDHHLDSLRVLKNRPDSALGIYYLWKGPLNAYIYQGIGSSKDSSYFKRWSEVAPLYGQYGKFLIRRYPAEYIKYFLIPNLLNYFVPPTEFMGTLNLKQDNGDEVARRMLKVNNISSRQERVKLRISSVLPLINCLVNLSALLSIIGLIYLNLRKENRRLTVFAFTAAFFCLLNFVFSISASPIVLRYQIFNQLIELAVIIPVANLILMRVKSELSGALVSKTVKKMENEPSIA